MDAAKLDLDVFTRGGHLRLPWLLGGRPVFRVMLSPVEQRA
jgi:hypothetical protein